MAPSPFRGPNGVFRSGPHAEGRSAVKELLIFVHIPKTAGTTFAAILERNFRPSRIVSVYPNFGISEAELRALPDESRRAMECVKGHFDYGIHRALRRPFRYVTFLRHPVEQLRSRYNHMRSSRSHPLHHLARQGISLEEFVRVSPDNYQTRTLAGIEPRPGQGYPVLTERDLEQVKANVEEHFGLVGIAERFDPSLILARRSLGLERILYVSRNVRRHPGQDPPPSEPSRPTGKRSSTSWKPSGRPTPDTRGSWGRSMP